MKKILLLLFTVVFLFGCEGSLPLYWVFDMQNDSDHDVCFYLNFERPNGGYHGKTGWPKKIDNDLFVMVNKGARYRFSTFPISVNELIPEEDSLTVFIFSPDTLKKYSYDEIRRTNNYLERYDDTVKKLFHIIYPIHGTEEKSGTE